MNKRHIITVCGVIVGLSLMFVAGTAAGQNASDYPPEDIVTEVQELDENGSVNSTIGLDHARGYDTTDGLNIWDWSIQDGNTSNLTDEINNIDLQAPSGATTNADSWNFSAASSGASVDVSQGTENDSTLTLSATFDAKYNSTASDWVNTGASPIGFAQNIGVFTASGGDLEVKNPSGGAALTWASESTAQTTVTLSLQSGNLSVYQDGVHQGDVSGFGDVNSTKSLLVGGASGSYSGRVSDVSLYKRSVSKDESDLLADEYRLGAFVPDQQTTTGRNLGENQSLTWNVSNLRDSEVTLKTQYYDGSNWVTDQELTVSNAGKFDVAVNNPGNEYRYITTPQSTVDSSSGGFFTGGSGDNTLYIFGFSFNQSNFMLGSGVVILIGILAFFYPGMELFGRTES